MIGGPNPRQHQQLGRVGHPAAEDDLPRRASLLCTEALEALSYVPTCKQTNDLKKKIETSLKKIKPAS